MPRADFANSSVPDFSDIPDLPALDRNAAPSTPSLKTWLRLHGRPGTRREVSRKRWLGLGVAGAWALVQFAALGVRFDFAKLPGAYVLWTIVAPLVIGSIGLAVALSPGRLGLGMRSWLMIALVLAGPLWVIGGALAMPEPYAGGIAGDRQALFLCGNLALGWAALPALCAALTLQSAFVSGALWRSVLVGTACGVGAAVAAQLRCPLTGSAHIAIAHGGVIVISALLGALLLPRATRV
jgi:hypothetical protein